MRRIDAARSRPLAAIHRLETWKVDRARTLVARTSADLQQAQQHADALALDACELAEWARSAGRVHPTVHVHVVDGLGKAARLQQQARIDSDRCGDVAQGARDALVLVQARQKALDCVAERMAARMGADEAGRLAREMDELWLCSHVPESDR